MPDEDEVGARARVGLATRRRAVRLWIALAVLVLATHANAAPAPPEGEARSEDPAVEEAMEADTDESDTASWRRLGFGFAVGYGSGLAPRRQQSGRDVADVELLTFEPQLRLPLIRAGEGNAWYHGVLEATLDALLIANFSPRAGHGGGANAGLRYRLMPGRRIQPYAAGSLGIGGIGFDLVAQDNGFAFFLQAGAGARVRLDDRVSLAAGVRWLHISNAQTHPPNAGIDTIGFRVGIEIR